MRFSLACLLVSAALWLTALQSMAPMADAQSYHCPAGYDCVYDQVRAAFPATPMVCDPVRFAGFTCDGQNLTMCKAGKYCPTTIGVNAAVECPDGHWCPQGFSYALECEPGATCPKGSAKQRLWTPVIALVAGMVLLTVVYQLVRRGYITGAACGCDHKPDPAAVAADKPVGFGAAAAAGGRIVNVGAVRIGSKQASSAAVAAASAADGRREQSLTSGGADVSFMMSGGMRTSIVFDDVSIEVGTGPFRRTVLHHLTGKFQSGRLSAIMGPSGSGKSTAMNALTGRIKLARGSVTLNGVTPLSKLDKIVGFVGQEDIMLPMLTVRQVLVDNALARLPVVWPLRKKLAIVDDVLEVLHLTKVADSVIGDVSERGVSGGEKKRVSVGMELVADPAVLFLDEPTSGLDASSAKDLMAALQRVAQRGLIVVSVIHQPRSEIYSMIDDLLLLRTGGHTVYFGEAAAAETYLTWLGFPLPPNCNPADHQLDVVSGRVPLRLMPPGTAGAALQTLPPPTPSELPTTTKDEKKKEDGAVVVPAAATMAGLPVTVNVPTMGLTITVAPLIGGPAPTTTPATDAPAAAAALVTAMTGNVIAGQALLKPPEGVVLSAPPAHLQNRRGSEVAPRKKLGAVAIRGREVPQYLTEAWLNYRTTFASGKFESVARDVEIKCTQKQIDSVLMTGAPPQLVAAAATLTPTSAALAAAKAGGGANLVDAAATSTVPLSLATLTLPAMMAPIPLPNAAAPTSNTTAGSGGQAITGGRQTPQPPSEVEMQLMTASAHGVPRASMGADLKQGDALRPLSADAKEKAAMLKAEAALIEDVVAVRSPPSFLTQVYLYLYRRFLVDIRAPFPTLLDIGLQILSGLALASGGSSKEYYAPPLPLDVAATCPSILRERCEEKALVGVQPVYMGFFVTMVICVACSNFAVRTFGQWMPVWNREKLCGRDLYAYFTAQALYDLIHVTRSALFFTACFYPVGSWRGTFGWWYLTFWLLIFACYGMGYFVSVAISYQLSTVVTVVLGVALSITSGLTPRLDVVADWWPLPIFWSISYNRWGAEALINIAIRAQSSAPEDRVDRGVRALGYSPDQFTLDLCMLLVIGVMWRLLAFLKLKYRKASV